MSVEAKEAHVSDIKDLLDADFDFWNNEEKPPIVDPNLDFLVNLLEGRLDYTDQERIYRGLTDDGIRVLNGLSNEKLKSYYSKDVWQWALCLLYLSDLRDYAIEHENDEDIDCDYFRKRFSELQKLTTSWKEAFDETEYQEYSRIIATFLLLANVTEPLDVRNQKLINEESRKEILAFLENNDLSIEEEKTFLKKYGNITIYVDDYEKTFDNEEKSSYGFSISSLAHFLQKFKHLQSNKNVDILKTIEMISSSAQKHGGKGTVAAALLLHHDMTIFRSFLNHIMNTNSNASYHIKRKDGEKFILKQVNTLFIVINILEPHCQSEQKRLADYAAERVSDKLKFDQVYRIIQELDDDTLIDGNLAKSLLKNIVYEDTSTFVKDWIGHHNNHIYEQALNTYHELISNPIIQFIALLREHHLTMSEEVLDRYVARGLIEFKEMLLLLKSHHLSSKSIAFVLQRTNYNTVSLIDSYIKSGYLSNAFVCKNLDIYDVDGETLSKYNDLIKFLKEFKINPSLFIGLTKKILNNLELFKRNILLLNEYCLLSSLKKAEPEQISIVLDDKLAEKIDKFIEAGCYEVLSKDFGLLTCNDTKLKRIDVIMGMNLPIGTSNNELLSIYQLVNGKFFISEEDLENYIFVPEITDEDKKWTPDIEEFERFRVTKQSPVMKIGSSVFSYPKVIRKMNDGLSFAEALFYNRSCTQGSYEDTMEEIRPLIKEYV